MARSERFLLLVLAAVGWTPVYAASILYTDIGPGYAGDSTIGYGSPGSFFGTTFTTTAGGSLSEVIVGVGSDTTTMAPAALYTNSGGEPGTLLESWNVTLPFSTGNTVTLISLLQPVLSANTQYWFVFGPGAEADGVQLTGNDTGILGGPWAGDTLTGLSAESGPGYLTPGIEVIGAASVPEPGTGALIALTSVALAALRRFLA